jgi:phosphonate transport system substrate-binding protein
MGRLACCLCLLLGVVLLPVRPALARDSLGFGLIATFSPNALLDQWQPLLDDMAAALGVPVTPRLYDDYAGVIWAMAAGHVQVAWLGNKSAIEAVDRAGGEVACQAVEVDGRTEYNALLIARADSGLCTVDDVFARAGELTYGDGDVNSTSGHVIPGHFLFAPRGVEPRAVFRRVVQNNHEDNFLGVAEGRLDVATGNTINLAGSMARHPEAAPAVTVVWTSPPIPSDPLVWRADLDTSDKEAIRAFLLGYGREAPEKSPQDLEREQAVLRQMHRAGFRASDNGQLRSVRRIELNRQRSRVLADAGLPRDERLRRLAVIDAKLDALAEEPR